MLDKILYVRQDYAGFGEVSIQHAYDRFDRFGNALGREVYSRKYKATPSSIARINDLFYRYRENVQCHVYNFGSGLIVKGELTRYSVYLGDS